MSHAQQVVLAVADVIAGFAVGSFICVVIERLPLLLDEPNQVGDLYDTRPWGEVLGGSSRCSGCGAPIRAVDKIPVVSWLLLRGKCRSCGDRIPGFHPVVELAVPALGLGVALAYGWGWRILPVLWLVPVGVAISAIDIRTLIVPTRIVWPAFGVTLVLSGLAALFAHQPRWLFGGLVGLVTLAGPLFVIWFIMPRGMGFGDVRLAVLLGWTVGFSTLSGSWATAVAMVVVTIFLSAALGIAIGVVALGARGRSAKVPLGPSMFVAALFVIAFAEQIMSGIDVT